MFRRCLDVEMKGACENGFTLRRLERVFRCCIVCDTKEDYKEGCLMVWANYMSPCNSIAGFHMTSLNFKLRTIGPPEIFLS